MGRLHLFEIHEQPWCPLDVKIGVRDALYTAWKLFFWKNTMAFSLYPVVSLAVQICPGAYTTGMV